MGLNTGRYPNNEKIDEGKMNTLLEKLSGGDRRSIGKVDEVVQMVLSDPSLFDELFNGFFYDDPVIRMRTADAVEKISARNPGILKPYRTRILKEIARIEQQEVHWHVAQMLPRLKLKGDELQKSVAILKNYMDDESKIVKTFSLQALTDLAKFNPELQPEVIRLLKKAVLSGSPAIKARAKKLLSNF